MNLLCRLHIHRWRALTSADAPDFVAEVQGLWNDILANWHQCLRCGWREPR